jgi:predicted XRE-type DNA-binding protein
MCARATCLRKEKPKNPKERNRSSQEDIQLHHESGAMMAAPRKFSSVWDALEDDPVRVQNLKLRSELMIHINTEIAALKLTQTQAAELLHLTQPRVSALLRGKIEEFRLDSLVDIAHRLGLSVELLVAA